jgi:hypothetical protein
VTFGFVGQDRAMYILISCERLDQADEVAANQPSKRPLSELVGHLKDAHGNPI